MVRVRSDGRARSAAGRVLLAALLLVGLACGGEQDETAGAGPDGQDAMEAGQAMDDGGAAAGAPSMQESAAAAPDPDVLRERALAIFRTLPEEVPSDDNPLTPEKIDLGRLLYYETRMSIGQDLSCNSCHQLAEYGVDNEPTSPGHKGQRGTRNSPTVYNAALHVAQFWDGRAPTLEEQAKGPVLNPVEMGMPSKDYVMEVLTSIPGYEPLFQAAFPGEESPITYDNVGKAIGAFERKLLTPAPFDAFLAGDAQALSEEQLVGLQTFLQTGCVTCHNGPALGGQQFQKIGVVKPYPTEDLGRYEVTGNESDRYVFKVPSLRNIEKTGPYLHDGSIESLDQMIRIMAEHQLGKSLSDEEVASIRAFLGSLTGELPTDYIAVPEFPASGPETPGPEA